MKHIITIILTIIILSFILTSCGKTVVNEYGLEVHHIGPYIEISSVDGADASGNFYTFYLVYDNETKIIYRLATSLYRAALTEHYIIGEDGYAHMCKWENGEIVEIPNP